MSLFVVTIDHTLYGSRGPAKVEPVSGVFDSIEKANNCIKYLIKTREFELCEENFEISEVKLNKIYYDVLD
jgi:hypothetical protein